MKVDFFLHSIVKLVISANAILKLDSLFGRSTLGQDSDSMKTMT